MKNIEQSASQVLCGKHVVIKETYLFYDGGYTDHNTNTYTCGEIIADTSETKARFVGFHEGKVVATKLSDGQIMIVDPSTVYLSDNNNMGIGE